MTRYALLAAALMAALAFAYGRGLMAGKALLEARLVQERESAREALASAEAARLVAVAERALLAQDLEDAAREDPVAVPICLSPDRVRRLNALR